VFFLHFLSFKPSYPCFCDNHKKQEPTQLFANAFFIFLNQERSGSSGGALGNYESYKPSTGAMGDRMSALKQAFHVKKKKNPLKFFSIDVVYIHVNIPIYGDD